MPTSRLPRAIVDAIDASKILGVRAGTRSRHRFVGVWPVVVEGRVLVRSWTLKLDGWYRTFLEDPYGTIQVGTRQVRVRAVKVRSERLRDAVDRAYAAKYATPGSASTFAVFAPLAAAKPPLNSCPGSLGPD